MKKLLSTLCFGLCSAGNAQVVEVQKTVLCTTPDAMFQELGKEYRERIYWAGAADQSNSVYMLWVNSKENTWTLTQSTKDVSCIIGAGKDNRLLLGSPL